MRDKNYQVTGLSHLYVQLLPGMLASPLKGNRTPSQIFTNGPVLPIGVNTRMTNGQTTGPEGFACIRSCSITLDNTAHTIHCQLNCSFDPDGSCFSLSCLLVKDAWQMPINKKLNVVMPATSWIQIAICESVQCIKTEINHPHLLWQSFGNRAPPCNP